MSSLREIKETKSVSFPKLTLGIPTYNRAEIVGANLKDIIDNDLNEIAHVLIIDNCSTDGTYEHLEGISRGRKNIRVIRQIYNKQLFGNVMDLHRHCRTQYLLINSDEDFFCREGVEWANDFLQEKNVSFLSGAVTFHSRSVYRKRSSRISETTIRNASNYGSGLIYHNEIVVEFLEFLEKNKNIEIAWLYPMFATALLVFLKSPTNCYEEPVFLSNKQFQVETLIEDSLGGKYYHLESRLRQFRSLPSLATQLKELFGVEKAELIDGWLETELKSLYPYIRKALKMETDRSLLQYFDHGALKYWGRLPLRRFKTIVKRLLSHI